MRTTFLGKFREPVNEQGTVSHINRKSKLLYDDLFQKAARP